MLEPNSVAVFRSSLVSQLPSNTVSGVGRFQEDTTRRSERNTDPLCTPCLVQVGDDAQLRLHNLDPPLCT